MFCRRCNVSFPMRSKKTVGGIVFITGYCPKCKCKIIRVEKEEECLDITKKGMASGIVN